MSALVGEGPEQFLLETLLWTGVLIGIVLLLRRPVSRWLGPQAAYALWALPFARLLMPPLELPAWLAPAEPAAPDASFTYTVMTSEEAAAPLAATPAAEPVNWLAIALVIWALGTTAFLVRRFQQYFAMRRELLAEARPMGEAGKVRLIETPATNAPIAFGVRDKIIALPLGFMALTERTTRDLALEHELAHHRGHDLLANFAVQPLFAMHWFNPLGWVGWRAMRRDQEAACDARVIASRGTEHKGAYASVIAGFATGPHVALAAPMACPVLGDKSIIHRLRSLTMSDISPRRRTAGRALMAAGLLALPLTATITYASAPAAPAAPAAPLSSLAPGAVPVPPAPPAPPLPMMLQAAPDIEVEVDENGDTVRVERRVIVHNTSEKHADGSEHPAKHVERKVMIRDPENKLSAADRDKIMAEVRRSLDEADAEIDAAMHQMRVAKIELDGAKHGMTKVSIECRGGDKGAEWRTKDGETVTRLCTSDVMAQALEGLKQARAEIARTREMDAEMRAEVIKALDEKIASWKSRD
uniref:M56 family metallopeptidase n=1 Tax=Parerythrobacter lutipelagi TaxID=1964208 RepID=UPI0010FA4F19|nr:M56 family metallopeptidase [Parerythrobacter lutipelagi]